MLLDQGFFAEMLNTLKAFGHVAHLPMMACVFVVGIILRGLIYYTVKRHEWFGREFENRVVRFLESEMDHKSTNVSFYMITKKLLEKSFFEVFLSREKSRKSKLDVLVLPSDRLFLVKEGCSWLVHDLLRQIRFLRYGADVKLVNITKSNFSKNPAFNRVFGVFPLIATNDLISALPGLFVIGGIFGTFLSVMGSIPGLSGMMSSQDPTQSQEIMNTFLGGVATSMGMSVIGIFLSVCTNIYNTAFNPERLYSDIIDRFENSLDLLWNYSHSNEVPSGVTKFDQNRDPEEALAEAAMSHQLEKSRLKGEYSDPIKPKSA